MKYNDFAQRIKSPIFSLNDLRLEKLKVFPYQLSNWVDKGYIIKLKNGLYCFANYKNDLANEHIAFRLYQPSYISLEWALAMYGIIPEMVYNITSITAKSTRTFQNELGTFIYRSVKKELFFGYTKMKINEQVYLIAEQEKALMDFLYLNSAEIKNCSDFNSFRFNEELLAKMNKRKIETICKIMNNKSLNKIIKKCLLLKK